MHHITRPLTFLIAAAGLLGSAVAQVEVTKGNPRVAVEAITGAQGPEVTKVLQADLKRTMLMDVTGPGDAPFTISGTYENNVLQGKLRNAAGQILVDGSYNGGDWRHATHRFADEVTKAVTGVDGFATGKVAFISSHSGQKELYVMDIDGANARQLTQDKTISNGPAWSADGSRIAYTSYKSGYPDVYIIDVTAGKRTRVAAFPGINSGPSFSTDGETLALTLSKDGNPEIYTMPAAGGEPTRLTRTRGTETSPSWSPDGSQLVYSSDERGSPQLFVIPATGGESERLRTNIPFNVEPSWSPDGNHITFTVRSGGQFQIAVYDMNKRQGRQITKNGGEDSSWTANSRHVVYSRDGKLHLLDSQTGNSVTLNTPVGKCTEATVTR